jgi:hypothetical protein
MSREDELEQRVAARGSGLAWLSIPVCTRSQYS